MNSSLINVAVILGSLFILNTFLGPEIKEAFLGNLSVPFTVKAMKVASSGQNQPMYNLPGTYQAALSPRFSNVDYGANITYNMPSKDMLAVDPTNPLSLNSMVYKPQQSADIKELYGNTSSLKTMAMPQLGNVPMQYTEATDMLPVTAMGGQAVNNLGEATVQPIIYDRFIYANQKSRTAANGDYIRGDLPIVANNSGWFQTSYNKPNIDLQAGALAVIGGVDNGMTRDMLALRSAASGGLINTSSGINYAVQSSPYTSTAGGDVLVTAYP